jgi:hypothetical protein
MHALELKVPPPAVALIFALLMWLVSWAVPQLGIDFPGRVLITVVLARSGLGSEYFFTFMARRARCEIVL